MARSKTCLSGQSNAVALITAAADARFRRRTPAAIHFLKSYIGTTLALLTGALSIRKRLSYQGMGRLSLWLSAHIYLGVVAAIAIFSFMT